MLCCVVIRLMLVVLGGGCFGCFVLGVYLDGFGLDIDYICVLLCYLFRFLYVCCFMFWFCLWVCWFGLVGYGVCLVCGLFVFMWMGFIV